VTCGEGLVFLNGKGVVGGGCHRRWGGKIGPETVVLSGAKGERKGPKLKGVGGTVWGRQKYNLRGRIGGIRQAGWGGTHSFKQGPIRGEKMDNELLEEKRELEKRVLKKRAHGGIWCADNPREKKWGWLKSE